VIGLKSRIPTIIADLPGSVQDAIAEGVEPIVNEARDRAPEGPTGDLAQSIEIRDPAEDSRLDAVFREDGAIGIYAAWYWRFPEFGTVRAAAQPFMIPAVESNTPGLISTVEEALEDL
jgi:HK97 gp10 family phage protein